MVGRNGASNRDQKGDRQGDQGGPDQVVELVEEVAGETLANA